ncbi:MAG TPA: hypothetical protein PKI19_08175 [Elusimicrobiales bacterium]|nr:hypothetical protein [Elusimicrobiales bacterium]
MDKSSVILRFVKDLGPVIAAVNYVVYLVSAETTRYSRHISPYAIWQAKSSLSPLSIAGEPVKGMSAYRKILFHFYRQQKIAPINSYRFPNRVIKIPAGLQAFGIGGVALYVQGFQPGPSGIGKRGGQAFPLFDVAFSQAFLAIAGNGLESTGPQTSGAAEKQQCEGN